MTICENRRIAKLLKNISLLSLTLLIAIRIKLHPHTFLRVYTPMLKSLNVLFPRTKGSPNSFFFRSYVFAFFRFRLRTADSVIPISDSVIPLSDSVIVLQNDGFVHFRICKSGFMRMCDAKKSGQSPTGCPNLCGCES